jgi:hypothetical protein
MKKRILFFGVLSAFLLIMIPNIQAVEINTINNENISSFFEKIQNIDIFLNKGKNVGIGLLELFIALLIFLYIQLGIIFNRSFTLILLLANILYEIGIRLGIIELSIF